MLAQGDFACENFLPAAALSKRISKTLRRHMMPSRVSALIRTSRPGSSSRFRRFPDCTVRLNDPAHIASASDNSVAPGVLEALFELVSGVVFVSSSSDFSSDEKSLSIISPTSARISALRAFLAALAFSSSKYSFSTNSNAVPVSPLSHTA